MPRGFGGAASVPHGEGEIVRSVGNGSAQKSARLLSFLTGASNRAGKIRLFHCS